MSKTIDLNFNINPVAVAIAHLLKDLIDEHGDMVDLKTYALYNGREKGICVVRTILKDGVENSIAVSFGEHRSSDGLFVEFVYFKAHSVMNMSHDIFTEESYELRKDFKFNQLYQVRDAVYDLLSDFETKV